MERAFQRRQKAHGDAGPSKPCGEGIPEGRTQAYDPGQGAAAVTSLRAQPNGCQPPRAPLMRPVPLPGRQERDEPVLNGYGQKLAPGNWWTGTVQADNNNLLSCLDMAMPVPFTST
jgi:hypothetical protein